MKQLCFGIAVLLLAATSARADVLAEWDGVAGSFQSASFEASGITAIDLTRGSGINSATGDNFNSNGFTVGGDLLDAINNNDFLSFGFNASSSVDLENIVVELDRSGTGPGFVNLFSDVTGFGAFDVIETKAVPTTGSLLTFDLTGVSAFQGFTGDVEFRFYFNGATSGAGTSDIEDDLIGGNSGQVGLQVNSVTIPEPSAFALFGLAGLGVVAIRRRK